MGNHTTDDGLDRVSDEDLHNIATRLRSIRHRESRAKMIGSTVAFVLGVGLFFGTYPVLGDELGTELRFLIAAIGVILGAFVYRWLAPKDDPADVT